MNLIAVRNAKEKELPWSKNSIYKFYNLGRYPEVIIKIDGKIFLDMDAFRNLARQKRDEQIAKAKLARRSTDSTLEL